MSNNMAAPYWALYMWISAKHFIWSLGKRRDLKFGEVTFLPIYYNITVFFTLSANKFSIYSSQFFFARQWKRSILKIFVTVPGIIVFSALFYPISCSFLKWFGHVFSAVQVLSVRGLRIATTTCYSGLFAYCLGLRDLHVTLANPQTFGSELHLMSLPCAFSRQSINQLIALLFAPTRCWRDSTKSKKLSSIAILGFQFDSITVPSRPRHPRIFSPPSEKRFWCCEDVSDQLRGTLKCTTCWHFLCGFMTFSYYVMFIHNVFIFKRKAYRPFYHVECI